MQALGNPTKANLVSSMPAAAGEEAPMVPPKNKRPPLPGSAAERKEKQAAKEAFKKALEEGAQAKQAAQGAAGGGGDEERQQQIQEFNNFLRAVEAEAAAANEAATNEWRTLSAKEREVAAAANRRTPEQQARKEKERTMVNSPSLGPMVVAGVNKVYEQLEKASVAKARVKVMGEEKVQKARDLLARLKSGENYAALVAERDAQ